jgi:hypothetical protein
MIRQNPELLQAKIEAEQVTPENYLQWVNIWIERYGQFIPVPRMIGDEHERIDALSELAEKVHPSKIIVI